MDCEASTKTLHKSELCNKAPPPCEQRSGTQGSCRSFILKESSEMKKLKGEIHW